MNSASEQTPELHTDLPPPPTPRRPRKRLPCL